jgi:hypothetical protein
MAVLPTARNVMLPHFGPSRRTLPAGLDGVIFVRASLYGSAPEDGRAVDSTALLSRHDYTFAVAEPSS